MLSIWYTLCTSASFSMFQLPTIWQVFLNQYDIDNVDISYQNINMYRYGKKKGISTSLDYLID